MKELSVQDDRAVGQALDQLHGPAGMIMIEMPAVFVLVAPSTTAGVAALNRVKIRLPGKNYGTAIGDLASFRGMAVDGSIPEDLAGPVGFELFTGAFIRMAVGPVDFQSPVVRDGRHQGLLAPEGPWRRLFREIEASFGPEAEPALFGGHRYAAPLCTSTNISGDPAGSITELSRAREFGRARGVPLLLRDSPAAGETGSFPIFSLHPG
ncbi:MAG: hypothetical protein RLY31_2986, partial [Bacteroidota bacterium]